MTKTTTAIGLLLLAALAIPATTAEPTGICEEAVACILVECNTVDGVHCDDYACVADGTTGHTGERTGVYGDGRPAGEGSIWLPCPPPSA